jgi:hypothetical protein
MQAEQLKLAGIDDLDERLTRWEAFWQGEVYKRPPVTIVLPAGPRSQYYNNYHNAEAAIRTHIEWVEQTQWLGDSLPSARPDFGPDQYAAWLGAELRYSPDSSQTNWVTPFVQDWPSALPLDVKLNSPVFTRSLELLKRMAADGWGKFLVYVHDLHSNCDALSAIRGPDNLSMDFYDDPDHLKLACSQIGDTYEKVFLALEQAGQWATRGYIGWLHVYSTKRFAVTQCDYSCMVSSELFNKYILPELRKEWVFLDRSIYHLDGTTALTHLPALLAEPDLDGIQWLPQAGQKPQCMWEDVLMAIRNAGKRLDLHGTPDQIRHMHKLLGPAKCVYHAACEDADEASELLDWMEQN